MEVLTENQVKQLLRPRARNTHKGTYGRILIVAGSPGMAGAAVLSARSALRSGAGLVRVSIEEPLFPVIHVGVVEATCISRSLSNESLDTYDAIAVGPGLGTDAAAIETVDYLLSNYSGTLILDADALNIIAHEGFKLSDSTSAKILTPHEGEAARLLAADVGSVQRNREGTAKELAARFDAVAILKGHGTIVALPTGSVFENPTGNPGMATAGSGDVLTGVVTALAGQGLSPANVAKAGVYIHGLAGDLAKQEKGEYGLIAGDITEAIPAAIKKVQR
ncbi:MAG: NAD(P)H-hydrate dehydratase [Clostridiales Family XIII bacterium]|jgi:NAD(P)H-hydrate epimerase|nr:NAD(P)H-hydrate dehydratase [Clostridiales Family XIII bacterium]